VTQKELDQLYDGARAVAIAFDIRHPYTERAAQVLVTFAIAIEAQVLAQVNDALKQQPRTEVGGKS